MLVNDFGAINVDAALVASSAGDAIVVEASGVSDPWRIAQLALADPALEPGVVVVIVDAAAPPAQSKDPRLADTLARQLAAADLVVLNKTDLATGDELSSARAWAAVHAPGAAQFESVALRPSAAWTPDALRERIAALPGGVLRIKGFVRRDDGRFTELQYAGRHASLRTATAAPEGGPVLVAIGLRGQLPAAELRALFGTEAAA